MQLCVSLEISWLKYIEIKINIKYFISSFKRKPVIKIRNANVFSDFYVQHIYSGVSFVYNMMYDSAWCGGLVQSLFSN
jgi:hypothetical protein